MSIWDTIKPTKKAPTATQVDLSADKRVVTLTWDDGKVTKTTARSLRNVCPCAACVDEWTNVRRHDPKKVPDTTTVQNIVPVGNYALAFTFSDSHDSGIFPWDLLRQVSESGNNE